MPPKLKSTLLVVASAVAALGQVNLGGTSVPKDRIIVYLFVGHSNVCSSGPERYSTIHERTWNYRIDDGNHRWVHAQDPVHDAYCWGGSNGGPATQFLKAMMDAYPGYHFGVLQNADKASSINNTSSCSDKKYAPGGGLYNELVDAAREIRDKVTIGGIFVNLGMMERSWSDERVKFAASVKNMVESIRSDLGLPAMPLLMQQFEMGATGSYAPTTTGAQEIIRQINSLPSIMSHCAVVPTNWSTQSGMMQDDHHFSKKGHDRLAPEILNAIRNAALDSWAGSPDSVSPTAPTNLQATASGTNIALSWNASTDNSGVIGEYVAYGGTSELARFAGTSATGTVGSLSPNTAYTVTLKASDAAGNLSGPSNAVTVTTGEGAYASLPLQVNCGGTAGGAWLADRAFDGVWGYEVRQNAVTVTNEVSGSTTISIPFRAMLEAATVAVSSGASDAANTKLPPSLPSR